jgi:hypothetical protein
MNRSFVFCSVRPVNLNLTSQRFEAIQPDGLMGSGRLDLTGWRLRAAPGNPEKLASESEYGPLAETNCDGLAGSCATGQSEARMAAGRDPR